MDNFKIETYLKIIFLISLLSLISAYFIEYFLGHQPCNLCLIERIPYGISVFIIIINFISNKNEKFMIIMLILVFIFSLVISIYHYGIEQEIFSESAICSIKETNKIITKDELLKQLSQITISCKDVTFKIFGFSLTAINIINSLVITILLTKILNNYEKLQK